jgi:T-complex protein 1 subunit beta
LDAYAGLDSADLISQLRASHAHNASSRQGIDVILGGMGDMAKLGIFESFKVRSNSPVAPAKR